MKTNAVRKIIIVFLLLLPVITIAHYFIFPQETRCILLPFSNFKRSGNLYYKKMDAEKMHRLQQLKYLAETKDSIFWKENMILDYKIVYCDNQPDFNNYASPYVPAATNMKMGAYIIIKDESIDENIIAHELSHTILYRNIGWYKRTFTIPTWFDEGLAMQVDDRNYYSTDTLLAKMDHGLTLPDITQLKKPADFFSGDHETIMLHFSTSKYVVHEWLKTHSLKKFIEAINSGLDFEKAFSQK